MNCEEHNVALYGRLQCAECASRVATKRSKEAEATFWRNAAEASSFEREMLGSLAW